MASLPFLSENTKFTLGAVAVLKQISPGYALTCFCLGHCPKFPNDPSKNGTCEAKPGAKCFSAVEEVYDPESGKYEPERTYGCLPPDETGLLQCQGNLVPHLNPTSIACCSDEDYCNSVLKPHYKISVDSHLENSNNPGDFFGIGIDSTTAYILLITFVICLLLAVISIVCYYRKVKKEEKNQKKKFGQRPEDINYALQNYPGNLETLLEQSSGSGSGLPFLVQKTIAKQLNIQESIGYGRFGEVYLATWNSDKVAVKVFYTNEEASWERETEIYQTTLLRHENILGFIAADIRGTGNGSQRLIITDYHQNGSLHDFLKENVIDQNDLVRMAFSISNGLNHLHTEIKGRCAKPALAHRDVKSRNILVKNDGTCCIADFGLAVRYPNEKNEVEMGRSNTRVGTKRYMPPEVLSQTINVKNMEDFKQADMYSLGLVLWEMCLKTKTYKDGVEHYETYQLPYSEHVMSDPSCEEMLDIVCHKNLRPSIPTRWDIDEPLCYISKLMKECWMQNPKSRVNMMFVKKNLQQIQHSTFVSKQKSCIIETMTIPRYATINSSSTMSIPLKSAAYQQQRQLNSSISS